MSTNKLILVAVPILMWHGIGLCKDSNFVLNSEPRNITSPTKEMGIVLNMAGANAVPFDIRQAILKAPGDYFLSPHGAHVISITDTTTMEITSILNNYIKREFYDDFVMGSIKGFTFHLGGENLPRNEYHVRYSRADSIYVISGWAGKFLSFYRAVPGHIKYNFQEFQLALSKLSVLDIPITKDTYAKSLMGNPYFFEYIDKDKMIRIRCYHVSEIVTFDKEINNFITDPFTLIEITKFIDKEAMP